MLPYVPFRLKSYVAFIDWTKNGTKFINFSSRIFSPHNYSPVHGIVVYKRVRFCVAGCWQLYLLQLSYLSNEWNYHFFLFVLKKIVLFSKWSMPKYTLNKERKMRRNREVVSYTWKFSYMRMKFLLFFLINLHFEREGIEFVFFTKPRLTDCADACSVPACHIWPLHSRFRGLAS